MKSILVILSMVVLAGQAQASDFTNCIETLSFTQQFDDKEAGFACAYGIGHGQKHTDCVVDVADVMGSAQVATAGYLCGRAFNPSTKKISPTVVSCAVNDIRTSGKNVKVAVDSCKAAVRAMYSGDVKKLVVKK